MSDQDWDKLLSRSHTLYAASSSAEIEHELRGIEQLLVATPPLRSNQSRAYIVDLGLSRRSLNSDLWTVAVAQAYRRVLTTFDMAPTATSRHGGGMVGGVQDYVPPSTAGSVLPPGDEESLSEVGPGAGHTEHRVLLGATGRSASLVHIGAEEPSMPARSFDLPGRRYRMRNYNVFVTMAFTVVLFLSLAMGRDFGPFYFSNIQLWLLAVYGMFVVCYFTNDDRSLHVQLEAFTLFMFVALVVGCIMSVEFLTDVPARIDAYCADHATKCSDYSDSSLHAAGMFAGFSVCLTYFFLYLAGVREATAYVKALGVYLEQDGRPVGTCMTPAVDFAVKWLMPGLPCARQWNYTLCRGVSAPFEGARSCWRGLSSCCVSFCEGANCRGSGSSSDNTFACACLCCCFLTWILFLVLCAASNSSNSVACVIAEIMSSILQNIH